VSDKCSEFDKLTVSGMEVVKTVARNRTGDAAAWTEVLANTIWLKYQCFC
jgi:hypothetical protein